MSSLLNQVERQVQDIYGWDNNNTIYNEEPITNEQYLTTGPNTYDYETFNDLQTLNDSTINNNEGLVYADSAPGKYDVYDQNPLQYGYQQHDNPGLVSIADQWFGYDISDHDYDRLDYAKDFGTDVATDPDTYLTGLALKGRKMPSPWIKYPSYAYLGLLGTSGITGVPTVGDMLEEVAYDPDTYVNAGLTGGLYTPAAPIAAAGLGYNTLAGFTGLPTIGDVIQGIDWNAAGTMAGGADPLMSGSPEAIEMYEQGITSPAYDIKPGGKVYHH